MKISQQKLTINPADLFFGLFPQKDKNLRRYVPKKHLFWTSSARNAIFLLISKLKAEHKVKNKNFTIALPAFTCKVVLQAINEALKNETTKTKIIFYDSGVISSLEDIKKAAMAAKQKKHKIDVLILCYNFGYLPNNLKAIYSFCQKNKIILIEDCAQALGAKQKVLAGTYSDYAIYSFGISKNLGFTNGLIASNKKLIFPKSIQNKINSSLKKKYPTTTLFKEIFQGIISNIFFHKTIFQFTSILLKNEVKSHKNYPLKNYQYSRYAKNVIYHMAKRYSKILKQRRENYELIINKLNTNKNIKSHDKINKLPNSSFLYFFFTPKTPSKVKADLLKEKIEVDNMKSFICFQKNFPKAKKAAEKTLTTALYRNKTEASYIAKKLQKIIYQKQ